LIDEGWLAVSPSEASHALFSRFAMVNFPGAIVYRKSAGSPRPEQHYAPALPFVTTELTALAIETLMPCVPLAQPPPVPSPQAPAPMETSPTPFAMAESLYQKGRYAEAADTLVSSFARHAPHPQAFSLLARALANQGSLVDALAWCERWVAADKVDPAGHYLRAIILLERGDPEQARLSLKRALYLQPEFVLAHFALGNLARGRGRNAEADRHFANALAAVRGHRADDLLPESDGLSAGRLTEIIAAMTALEKTP
jgi:chemotaxis protein methyltransferase CheR